MLPELVAEPHTLRGAVHFVTPHARAAMAFEPDPDEGQPGTVLLPGRTLAYRWNGTPDAELIIMKKPESIYTPPPAKD